MVVLGIIAISTLPYFHDVITASSGTREWVPNLGIEEHLTAKKGNRTTVMGFSGYRVFLYTLFIHLFAHIGFLGWMMDCRKYYRIALMVPVVLSGYTVALILLNAKATAFNETSTKFYLTIVTTIAVLIYYFLDRRNQTILKEKESYDVEG